jgi:hypothetical protein
MDFQDYLRELRLQYHNLSGQEQINWKLYYINMRIWTTFYRNHPEYYTKQMPHSEYYGRRSCKEYNEYYR